MAKYCALRFGLFISFFICQHRLFSQVYSTDDRAKEKHFFYEVKEIDEFFERFNDEPGSFIRTVYKERNMKFRISRKRLVRTLFNYENRSLDSVLMKKFVSDVTNKNNPIYLDFYGNDWYAEINCKFRYRSSSIIVPIILKIEVTQNKGSKWMIVAVGRSRLNLNTAVLEMAESKIKTKCLSPTSHATNFVSLRRAFDDKENLSNYFENSCFKRSYMSAFYTAVLNRDIEFQHVTKIKYHFLLADKWIFTVEDFIRDGLNSGWLINRMQKVSALEMENYRNKLLDGN
ncbi:MAG: hypothetical protein JST75_21715 [Bacteroidetes bacterium]|nr:hypothetical protein [Bacteroidota bacterium]